MSKLPAQPNQSLIGGMECLETLVSLRRPVGCRELARLLGMDVTRVNRLLKTLAAIGMAELTPTRQYQAGPGIHVLAAMSLHASPLLKVSLRHLPALQAQLPNLSVALGVLWRSQVCYLYFGKHGERVEESLGRATLYPAELSSIGHVLLAAQRDAEVLEAFRRRLPEPLASNAEKPLLKTLATVRTQGYALINNKSISVPVGTPPVAGLAAVIPPKPGLNPAVLPALQETAAKIAAELKAGLQT